MNIVAMAVKRIASPPADDPVPHWLYILEADDGRLFWRVYITNSKPPDLEEWQDWFRYDRYPDPIWKEIPQSALSLMKSLH